jgi:hypothetical protein
MPQGSEIDAVRSYQRQILQQNLYNSVSKTVYDANNAAINAQSKAVTSGGGQKGGKNEKNEKNENLLTVMNNALLNILPLTQSTANNTTAAVAVAVLTNGPNDSNDKKGTLPDTLNNPDHRSSLDNVGANMLSPTIYSPHMYSCTIGSTPHDGAYINLAAALKNKLFFSLLLKQIPQSGSENRNKNTFLGNNQNQNQNLSYQNFVNNYDEFNAPELDSFTSTIPFPSGDIVFLTQAFGLSSSLRLYDIGPNGIGQAVVSLGADAWNNNINLTLQSRPTYLFPSQNDLYKLQNTTKNASSLNQIYQNHHQIHHQKPSTRRTIRASIAPTTTTTNPQITQQNTYIHDSSTLINALGAGLNHETLQNTLNDIGSWKLTNHAFRLTPQERALLDKPVIHLSMTRNVRPLFDTGPQTRAWCGFRASGNLHYPIHAKLTQNSSNFDHNNNNNNVGNDGNLANSTSTDISNEDFINLGRNRGKNGKKRDKNRRTTIFPTFDRNTGKSSQYDNPNNNNNNTTDGYNVTLHPSLSNLLTSFNSIYLQKSPNRQISIETVDTFSNLRLGYSHFFYNPFRPDSIDNDQSTEYDPNGSLSPFVPTMTTSLLFEVNLKQLRATQIGLYDRYYHHAQKSIFEKQRQQAIEYLDSVGGNGNSTTNPQTAPTTTQLDHNSYYDYPSDTNTTGYSGNNLYTSYPSGPILTSQYNLQHQLPQPIPSSSSTTTTTTNTTLTSQQQSTTLPLPSIPQSTSHPYILSPIAVKALLAASTSQLNNTYHLQASTSFQLTPTWSLSSTIGTNGAFSLQTRIKSQTTQLQRCTQKCAFCGNLRCFCKQSVVNNFGSNNFKKNPDHFGGGFLDSGNLLSFFGFPVDLNVSLNTNVFKSSNTISQLYQQGNGVSSIAPSLLHDTNIGFSFSLGQTM